MTLDPFPPPIAIDAFGALTIGIVLTIEIVVYFIGGRSCLTQKFRILGLFHPRTGQRRLLRHGGPNPCGSCLHRLCGFPRDGPRLFCCGALGRVRRICLGATPT